MRKLLIIIACISFSLVSCGPSGGNTLASIVKAGQMAIASSLPNNCVEWVPIGSGITLPMASQGVGIQYSIQPDTAGAKWVHLRGLIFGTSPIATDSVYAVLIDNLPLAIQSPSSDWAWMSSGYIIYNAVNNPSEPSNGSLALGVVNTKEIRMLRNPFYSVNGGWFVDLGNIKYLAR